MRIVPLDFGGKGEDEATAVGGFDAIQNGRHATAGESYKAVFGARAGGEGGCGCGGECGGSCGGGCRGGCGCKDVREKSHVPLCARRSLTPAARRSLPQEIRLEANQVMNDYASIGISGLTVDRQIALGAGWLYDEGGETEKSCNCCVTGIDVSKPTPLKSKTMQYKLEKPRDKGPKYGSKKFSGVGWQFTVAIRHEDIWVEGDGKKCTFDWLEHDSGGFSGVTQNVIDTIQAYCLNNLNKILELSKNHEEIPDRRQKLRQKCKDWSKKFGKLVKRYNTGRYVSMLELADLMAEFGYRIGTGTIVPMIEYRDKGKLGCAKGDDDRPAKHEMKLSDSPFQPQTKKARPNGERVLKIKISAESGNAKFCKYSKCTREIKITWKTDEKGTVSSGTPDIGKTTCV